MRIALTALVLVAAAGSAAAQTGFDHGASLRLQNERRWTEGQVRALEAEVGRLQTQQSLRRLESGRTPDRTVAARQDQLDAVELEALRRASQAASTATAARLRASSPAYDQRLRDLGYASSLPLARPRR